MDEKYETLLLVCLAVEPAMRKPSCAKHNASCTRGEPVPCHCVRVLLANRRLLPMAAHSFLPVGHLRDGKPRLPAWLRPDGMQGRDELSCTRRCSCAFELTARGRQDSHRHAASNDHARCPPAQLFAHLREGQGRRARSRLPDSRRVAPASRLAAAEDAHRVGETTLYYGNTRTNTISPIGHTCTKLLCD